MKPDSWIKKQKGMIEPFVDHTVREVDGRKVCSYGLSCAGYDIRLADDVYVRKVHVNGEFKALDPKGNDASDVIQTKLKVYEDEKGKYVFVPPGAVFGHTIEKFKMPANVTAFLLPKSTYARCGIAICNPLIEPGYESTLTVSFINGSNEYVRVYLNEGFAQMVFFDAGEVEKTYYERGGLYGGQGVNGVQFAKVS